MLTEIVLDISIFSPNGSYTSPPPGQAVFAEILLGCCHFFLGHIYILVLDPNIVAGTVDSVPQRCAIGLSSCIASSQGWCDSGDQVQAVDGPSPSSIPLLQPKLWACWGKPSEKPRQKNGIECGHVCAYAFNMYIYINK